MTTASITEIGRQRQIGNLPHVVGLVLLLAGLAVYAGCSKKSTAAEAKKDAGPKTVAVTVAPVKLRRDMKRTVDVVGSFQGLEEVTITPKVPGRVVKINYDVQDVVHTGDVLLEIDPTDFQLAVEEAPRARDSELVKLKLTEVPDENFDIAKLLLTLPSVAKAQALEDNAINKLRRGKTLYESKTLTAEDYEQFQADYQIAHAAHVQAEWDARATLAAARQKQAMLNTALQHLADTRVEVPSPKVAAAGKDAGKAKQTEYVVAERMVEVGEMVYVVSLMSKGVFRIVSDGTLKLLATVPERYVGQVKKEQVVEVTTEAYPGKVFTGTVKRINPTVDRTSRTFQVEVWVPNESRLLKVGGFAKLAIVTDTAAQALTVPVESLVTFAGVNKVFVVRDGKAHVVEVKPGEEGRDSGAEGRAWVEVTPKNPSELTPDLPVVTSGQTQLAEGSDVQLRAAEKAGKTE